MPGWSLIPLAFVFGSLGTGGVPPTPMSAFRRAYIARCEAQTFFGHIADAADVADEEVFVERGPDWTDVDDALRWARQRAPEVVLRYGLGDSETFSAGDRYFDGGDASNPLKVWPPSQDERRAMDEAVRIFYTRERPQSGPESLGVVEPERRPAT